MRRSRRHKNSETREVIEQRLNIIEFIRHPQILNEQRLSIGQSAILKSVYGLPLSDEELAIYCRGTGRENYDGREQVEITLLVGRRGGKTWLAAMIAVYEAFRHRLSRGDRAFVMLVAPVVDQARIAFDYIRKYILDSPELSKKVAKVGKNEIRLTNGITIGCYACSSVTVRGRSAVATICDELGFWRNKDNSANCDEEVLAALRPTMATFPTAKLLLRALNS